MDIRGKTKVFRQAHEGRNGTWYSYRTSVGKKNDDGTWDNDGYEIVLAKDAKNMVIPDGAVIDITDGFLSCRSYTDKGGEKKVVSQMVVMGFKMVAGQKTEDAGFGGGFTALADDVPF